MTLCIDLRPLHVRKSWLWRGTSPGKPCQVCVFLPVQSTCSDWGSNCCLCFVLVLEMRKGLPHAEHSCGSEMSSTAHVVMPAFIVLGRQLLTNHRSVSHNTGDRLRNCKWYKRCPKSRRAPWWSGAVMSLKVCKHKEVEEYVQCGVLVYLSALTFRVQSLCEKH